MNKRYSILIVFIGFLVLTTLSANAYILAEYYTGYGSGVPGNPFQTTYYRAKRLETNINFNWGTGGPGVGGIGDNYFAVTFHGWIYIPTTGNWTFYTQSDDGVRLRIDGTLRIDSWGLQGGDERSSGPFSLSAGWHKVDLDYFENEGGALVVLLYEGPGVSKQIIPPSAFDINLGVTQFQGIHGRYYRWSGGSPPDPFNYGNWCMNRYDPNVNFNWGTGNPGVDNWVGAELFAVYWHGNIYIPTSGNWTFYTRTDDGARLWIDGIQRINQWVDQGATEVSSGAIYLDAGWHDIEMQYYENQGAAVAELRWEGPGVSKDIIPQSALAVVRGHVIAQYFNANWPSGGTTLPSNFASERLERGIWHDWGTGSPEYGITADNFSGRWIGKIEIPTTGDYTFYVTSDDGADLYVNNSRIINFLGTPQSPTERSGTITLTGGRKYYFELKYDEFTGGAVCQVSWSGPGISKQMIPASAFYPILNEPPSDITLSPSMIGSNLPANTTVGTLSTFDIDNVTGANPPQTFTYTKVSGSANFYVDGNTVKTAYPNLTPGNYTIRVRTTDNGQRPDNLSYEKDLTITVVDTTPPTVSLVQVVATRWVHVTFSEAMGSGVTTPTNYVISGTGRGTLATNPNSVTFVSGTTYRLEWTSGEMRGGGDVTITVSNVRDLAGNLIGTPNSGTHVGGGMLIETPSISSVTSPGAVNTLPITINYTGASDLSSGINTIELWYKKGSGGTWTDSGLRSSMAPNGSFSFNAVSGEDTYYFALVPVDNAGNRGASPSGSGQTSTKYDITLPTPGSITVAPYTNMVPVPIEYGPATDNLSGVVTYRMYYKLGAGGTWTEIGVNLDPAGGSYGFTVPGNTEGTYYLGLRAVDGAGNDTGVPVGNGQASFVFDVTRPLNLSSVTINPQYANASALPVQVSYTGAADALSGLDYVRLWYRKGLAGEWTDTGLTLTTPNGTFNFTPSAGEGLYYLLVQPVDRAGNGRYVSGNGDGTTVYDNTPPTVGTVSSPDYASGAGISVGYTFANDGPDGSGVSSYRLWYKLGESGGWTEYSVALNSAGGNLTFVPPGGTNGRYYFDLRACDNAGNCSAMPSGNGQDNTLFDTVPPVNGTASSPAYSKWPVTVSYSGASDALSGLDFVRLYVKRGTGTWTATTLTSSGSSGSFAYTGTQDGVYYFAVVARDKAGNVGSLPTGNGDTTTIVDTVLPTVGSLSVVSATRSVPVSVSYSGCADNVGGSGLDVVRLWYKLGESGVWTDSGLSSSSGSGSFNFGSVTVDGRYYFGLEVIDKAGNSTGTPTGNGLGSVLVDRTAPVLGSLSLMSPTNQVPIIVQYSGCTDTGVGLSEVRLWYRYGAGGVWTDSGLRSSLGSGVFNFSNVSEDGVYYFGLQALDSLGNDTGTPTGDGLGFVVLDRSGPEVTVDSKVVTERTPELSGTVSDLSGVVSVVVRVGGREYVANVVSNQWTVQVTHPLRRGVYDVQVTAEDVLGQKGYDTTVDELFVDVSDPWVTVDRLVTNDPTPVLTGEMGPATADLEVVRVTVSVGSYTNTAELDTALGKWSMEVGVPLDEGVYDVVAEVEDSGSNISWDTTENELVIDLTSPEMVVTGPEPAVTTGEPVRYVVRYIGVKEVTLGPEDVELLVRNGEVSADIAVNPLGKDTDVEYEIVLSNFEGNGEVALHILPGTAVDTAGNYAPEYIGGFSLIVNTGSGVPVAGMYSFAILVVLVLASGICVWYRMRYGVSRLQK